MAFVGVGLTPLLARDATPSRCTSSGKRYRVSCTSSQNTSSPDGPPPSPPPLADAAARKELLFDTLSTVDFGRLSYDDDAAQKSINKLIVVVEALNPTPQPATSAKASGIWRLLYSNSAGTIGVNRPRFLRAKRIWQELRDDGTFENGEDLIVGRNLIYGQWKGASDTRVRLKFERFLVGGVLPIKFPGPAVGWQEQTYLDDDTRVCRTHLGSVVVMVKEAQ